MNPNRGSFLKWLLPAAVLAAGLWGCIPPPHRHHHDRDGHRSVEGKTAICHHGNTIYVDDSAVKGHLRHGDRLGPCR